MLDPRRRAILSRVVASTAILSAVGAALAPRLLARQESPSEPTVVSMSLMGGPDIGEVSCITGKVRYRPIPYFTPDDCAKCHGTGFDPSAQESDDSQTCTRECVKLVFPIN